MKIMKTIPSINISNFSFLSTALLVPAILFTASNSSAAGLEEIVVTSSKRVQNLQDVPVSVSAISGEKINTLGIQRAEELSSLIPNFSVQQDPIGDKINIRGIQSGNNAGLEQSVSTFVDGIYRGRGVQSRFAFLDVERIEVLRGPQGTLFGKNTIGGAVSIISAKPSEVFEGSITGLYTFENLDEVEVKGHITGPLSDSVRGRLAFQSREISDGYIDNIFYNESTPQLDETAVRGTLEWDFSSDTLVTVKLESADFDLQGQNFSTIESGPIAGFGQQENTYQESNIGSIDPILNFGSSGDQKGDTLESSVIIQTQMDAGELTSILSYSEYDFQRLCDCDFSLLDLIRFDDGEEFDQTSFEMRFASNSDGAFQYITGAYIHKNSLYADADTYFNVRGDAASGDLAIDTVLNLGCLAGGSNPGDRNCIVAGLVSTFDTTPLEYVDFNRYHFLDQDDSVAAAFFQGTYEVNETLRASLGLRYTREEKDAVQAAFAADYGTRTPNNVVGNETLYTGAAAGLQPFLTIAEAVNHTNKLNRKENSLTWSGNLQWDYSDDTLLYASVATGFKAGGFNTFAFTADPDEAEYEEEEVLSFEIGAKMSLLDDAAELNIAVFHSEFDDIQTALFTGSASFIVQNASAATSEGIEFDGRWAATDNLLVYGGLAYVDFEFDEFPNAGCYAEQLLQFRIDTANPLATLQECGAAGINDLSGKTSENTPEFSATLGLQHTLEIGDQYQLFSSLDLIYQDEQYRQADLDPVSLDDSFFKANLVLSFGPSNASWDISLIVKNLTDEESFSYVNDTPLVDGARQFIPDRPRTIGLSANYRF
ncbi:TonB-dependent receptor [Aurantivibrio infirmus]